jgi:hypothetical protein
VAVSRKVKKSEPRLVSTRPRELACGLIMPISAADGCSADHWAEVKAIVTEAVESIAEPRFAVRLVSDSDETGVIQKRIVQNVYTSEIVVCDVSGKNPNVMFELGLRLAFDKATVIIKDDKTDYSFDTGIIEHVPYPRDLRFAKIVEFKKSLGDKVLATYKISVSDSNHSPFLKNFGKFQVATLSQTEVSPDRIVVELLSELQSDVASLRRQVDHSPRPRGGPPDERTLRGVARIAAAVARFRRKHKVTDPIALMGDRAFYRYMEQDVEAPRFFDSPSDFEVAVNSVLGVPPSA